MKKIYSIIGQAFILVGIVFFLIHSLVIIKDPAESFSRDILGLIIPTPPSWTSYIPYLGFVIGILCELISMHGLVGIIISGVLIGLGTKLIRKEKFR